MPAGDQTLLSPGPGASGLAAKSLADAASQPLPGALRAGGGPPGPLPPPGRASGQAPLRRSSGGPTGRPPQLGLPTAGIASYISEPPASLLVLRGWAEEEAAAAGAALRAAAGGEAGAAAAAALAGAAPTKPSPSSAAATVGGAARPAPAGAAAAGQPLGGAGQRPAVQRTFSTLGWKRLASPARVGGQQAQQGGGEPGRRSVPSSPKAAPRPARRRLGGSHSFCAALRGSPALLPSCKPSSGILAV